MPFSGKKKVRGLWLSYFLHRNSLKVRLLINTRVCAGPAEPLLWTQVF